MRMTVGRGATLIGVVLLVAAACGKTSQSQAEASVTGQTSDDTVVAQVGDHAITLSELDRMVLASNLDVFQQLYDARVAALSALVSEALLQSRADEDGITLDELVDREVTSKIVPVTDEDVDAFFAENRDRLGGQTMEQIGGQVKEYLAAQREAEQRQAYLETLRADSDVSIDLDPPRVEIRVASGERIAGPTDAPVTIVEYSDFQ